MATQLDGDVNNFQNYWVSKKKETDEIGIMGRYYKRRELRVLAKALGWYASFGVET